MFKVTKNEGFIKVETGTVIWQWDLKKGGQITNCQFKGYHKNHTVLKDRPAPNLTMDLGGKKIALADEPVESEIIRQKDDRLTFRTKARYADLFTVEQEYDVFPEGVVFCEFGVLLDKGKTTKIRNAEMNFPLEIADAKRLRGNYMSRDPYVKQDVTCVHILSAACVCMERDKKTDMPHLLSLYGLDLGWEESRYFANRLEMCIEDATSIGSGMLGKTRTIAGENDDGWKLTWKLCENCDEQFKGPFLYRNKWALCCGAARTEAGPKADPARRNNMIGSKICHIMYPYVRPGDEWPWCSVPARQEFYEDAQLAKGNPELERVDEAAKLGANVLILHQFWMNNGGSNGEPMADYKVHDPKWFKAVIDRAHKHGMRVAVYTRGIEHYQLYSDFFEKYLTKDFDGLYIDWASPFALGYVKTSSMHCSIFNWYMFMRANRQRVGPNGFMISHTAIQSHASCALYDAVLCGEFSVMHSGLLSEPEISASYAGFGSCGVHLIAGNSPDRVVFSSQRSAGFSAGLGYSNHPFMEPDVKFADANAYVQPLWDLFTALGDKPTRAYNPSIDTENVFEWSDEALHPIGYKTDKGKVLIVVTNLSEQAVTGSVKVNLAALGLKPSTALKPIDAKGTFKAKVDGNKIMLENMESYFFTGILAG